MEASELFLWVWAIGATILAVWFSQVSRAKGMALVVMALGMKHVAEGKAEMSIVNGEMRIKKVEDKDATTN